jgi:hypothetical protein
MCAMAQNASEHQRSSELPRIPKRRSSQNSPSKHYGEWSILKMEEVAEWPNAAAFFLKVVTPVSRRQQGPNPSPLSARRQRCRQRADLRESEQVLRRHGP